MAKFDHEKLNVYQAASTWVAWSNELLDSVPKSLSVHNQLERTSTSKSSDRCRFFDIARGPALECAACLDVLVARKTIAEDIADEGKRSLVEIASMLVGLIRANSDREN